MRGTIRPFIRRADLERWIDASAGDTDRLAALVAAEMERRAAGGDDYARHVLDRAIRLGVEAAIRDVLDSGEYPRSDGGPEMPAEVEERS